MSNTAKTHKSRKTETPGKPRQRTDVVAVIATAPPSTSPVIGSSSDVPATTTQVPTDTQPVELPPEKQYWYKKPTSPLRKQAEKISVMKAAGRPTSDIAKRMKTTEANIHYVMFVARKNGWLDADDEPVDLEAELANNIDRKIVRNIGASLDGQMTNWQTHEMTIQAAKGRGVFKNYDKSESQQQAMTVVAIRVEMPTMGAEQQVVNEENIGGVPAYLEAEVCDENTRVTSTDEPLKMLESENGTTPISNIEGTIDANT